MMMTSLPYIDTIANIPRNWPVVPPKSVQREVAVAQYVKHNRAAIGKRKRARKQATAMRVYNKRHHSRE